MDDAPANGMNYNFQAHQHIEEREIHLENKDLYLKSSIFGASLGGGSGLALGAATGALSASWSGVQFGAVAGLVIGALTGLLTGALTVRVGGRTGGVSTGAYTGMLFGAVLGGMFGIFIPDSFRASVAAFHVLVLDVLTQGRFETAVLLSFLVSCIATMVGAWVGGRNLAARNLSKDQSPQ
ncbi:MAG: hypothetical protein HY864_03105 [Chloroflexi bacterium]|nr:hypothetical protein [Chloroflexota bacterium]